MFLYTNHSLSIKVDDLLNHFDAKTNNETIKTSVTCNPNFPHEYHQNVL